MIENKSESFIFGPFRNILLLATAWALTLSTSTLLTTVGPISATKLGASKSLAAFTVGAFLLGAAISSVPSGWLFSRFGRFGGFALGCLFQFLGSVFGTLALAFNSLTLIYFGCLSIGLAQGLGQFYRFSAVEITSPDLKSRAVTYVLSGGVLAAFIGPLSANYSSGIIGEDYMGSYMVVAIFAILNLFVICFVDFPRPMQPKSLLNQEASNGLLDAEEKSSKSIVSLGLDERTTWEIVTQPSFILSCTIATLAHTIMIMIMSNISVDMVDHGYAFGATSLVLELHFCAMFAPGFFSGKLIERYGSFSVAMIGGVIFAGSAVVLVAGTMMWNYILGMILVGIAWNFSFSAGTVMLTTCYQPKEATRVQAVNDFVLFTIAGAGSLISGEVYADYGWYVLIYVVSGLMLLYLALFASILQCSKPSEIESPLLNGNKPMSIASSGRSSRSDDFTGNPQGERGRSFSEMVGRKLSFSVPADDIIQAADDEMRPLRSISVA